MDFPLTGSDGNNPPLGYTACDGHYFSYARLIEGAATLRIPTIDTAPLLLDHGFLVTFRKRDVWDV
jgi:hypothetical protein